VSGGICNGGSDALIFGDDGTLYAGGWAGGFLGGSFLTVDKSSGAVLSAVQTDPHPFPPGSIHITGLARAPDGTLWVSRGANAADALGNVLASIHTIDPVTGGFTSTVLLSDPAARISDIAFSDGGTLFGSDPLTGMLVTIDTVTGVVTNVDQPFGGGARFSGLSPVAIEVPAEACTEPGGCDLGGQILELPEGLETDGVITSREVEQEENPGDNGVDTTVLADGRLLLPPQFRSSSPIAILEMDSDLVVTNGTILVTIEPGDFLEDPLPCDAPIPVGVDPQQQDIVVWQTTDAADIMEGRALEITSDCGGSSRGRSRGLSFFVVGLHLDCGVDWFVDPKASKKVRRCFADLTHTKFHGLIQAVLRAKHVLPRRQFRKLLALAVAGNIALHWKHYKYAEKSMTRLIKKLEKYNFETSDFNNSGNIEMRAYNVRFMLQKIRNIIANEG
jgi:hypothetical protein